jgi:hypothetical protein
MKYCRHFSYLIPAALLVTASNDAKAKAQAWVLPRGDGAISFTYQRIDNTGHRRTSGLLVQRGRSLDMSLYAEAEYALTNRLSATAGLPFVFSKYTDANPPPPQIPFLPNDMCAAGTRVGRTSALPADTIWSAAHLVSLR